MKKVAKSIHVEHLASLLEGSSCVFKDDDKTIELEYFELGDDKFTIVFKDSNGDSYDFYFYIDDIRVSIEDNHVTLTDVENKKNKCEFSLYKLVPVKCK
jgi:hypothetical protein